MSNLTADSNIATADASIITADGLYHGYIYPTLITADSNRITADASNVTADGAYRQVQWARVQAVRAGDIYGDYKTAGDVFDIYNQFDFSDSTVSSVAPGNPDYPVYGWMLKVPSNTALFSWASTSLSTPVNSVRRYVL